MVLSANFVNRNNSIEVAAIFAADFVVDTQLDSANPAAGAETDQAFFGFRSRSRAGGSVLHASGIHR